MPSALLVIAIAIDYSTGYSQEPLAKKLFPMPPQSCPENMEWTCLDPSKPTCSNLRPYGTFQAICRFGCQCKDGLYESNGRCVSDCFKEKCPGPNEVRSKCTARPECQPNCFPKVMCEEPCIPSECECEKGYIRVRENWGRYRCVSLATCEKLKKQYGSALPYVSEKLKKQYGSALPYVRVM